MSRIHQALTRPLPPPRQASGFNPLNGAPRAAGRYWWLVALLALGLAAVLIWSPWQRVVDQPPQIAPVAETPTVPAVPTLPASMNEQISQLQASLQSLAAEPSDTLALLPTNRPVTPVEPKETRVYQPVSTPTPAPEPTQPIAAEQRSEPAVSAPLVSAPVATPAETTNETGIVKVEQPWQDQVQAALADNNLTGAEQSLRAWIDSQPESAEPRIWLAKLLLSQQRLDAIGALLEQQDSIEARGLLALWHEKAGRPDQAVALFEQLSREQPTHGAWLLHWAINSENSGQLAQAVPLYHTYLNRFAADNPSLTAFARHRVRSLETP